MAAQARPADEAAEAGRPGLLLVRHRESTWNAEDRWTGHADPPLTERGRADARALGGVLAPLGLQSIISSDLRRARQTAELAARSMPGAVVLAPDPRLREIDIPAWTGLTKAELRATHRSAYEPWKAGENQPPDGAEAWSAFRERVLDALTDLAERDDRVLVVIHSGVLRVLREELRVEQKVRRSRGLWVRRRDGVLIADGLHRTGRAPVAG